MISTRFAATEWLTANMHRAYPLDEETAGSCPIPPALLADLFILVTGATDDDCAFYISAVHTTDTSVTINIAGHVGYSRFESTPVATFSLVGEVGSVASVSIPFETYTIHVKTVAGDLTVASRMPVHTTLTEESGKIFTGCVRGITGVGEGSFVVNGTQLPDQITLNAGQGIDFEVHNVEASVSFATTTTNQSGEQTNTTVTGRLVGVADDFLNYPGSDSPDQLNYSISALSIASDGTVQATITDSESRSSAFTGELQTPSGTQIAPAPGEQWDIDPDSLMVTEISVAPVVTISSLDYEIPEENTEITTDAELLAEAIELYGRPVRSINGVYPDERGNITIQPDEDTVESEQSDWANFSACIAGINEAAGAIKITLTHAVPCESTEIINSVMTNIAELNDRAKDLQEFITKLDAAQSNLAMKVAEMIR